jgi:hypothetical protein
MKPHPEYGVQRSRFLGEVVTGKWGLPNFRTEE